MQAFLDKRNERNTLDEIKDTFNKLGIKFNDNENMNYGFKECTLFDYNQKFTLDTYSKMKTPLQR